MLYLRKSLLPGAGKGLFTDEDIPKGSEIVEYEGEILPWSVVEERAAKGHEGYAFYISERVSVDAYFTPWAMGRYANDARGFGRIEGLRNNSQYVVKRKSGVRKVFIVASRSLKAGSEILVDYGNDYWRYLSKKPKAVKKTKTKTKSKSKKTSRKK
ncbi:MAG: SET domain-containing protein [Bacteroidota bacterium]